MTRKANTPKFCGENYKQYKKLVQLWEKVTDISEDDRGAALVLNMSGSALDIALAIDSTKTKVSDLIAILDGVYVEENNLSLKFDEFDQMKREKDRNIKEFIHVYEQKLNELKAEKLVLPDLVVANKFLRAANLSPNRYLLARSTCQTMTLAEAKAALLRVSDNGPSQAQATNNLIKVKQEVLESDDAIFYNGENSSYEEDEIYFQSVNRFRHNPYITKNQGNKRPQCYGCGETSHWLRDCPKNKQRYQNSNRNDVNRQCYGCGDRTHWIKDCPFIRDIQSLIRNCNMIPNQQRV